MEATEISFTAGMITMWLMWVGIWFIERLAKEIRERKEFRSYINSIKSEDALKTGDKTCNKLR